MLAESSTGHVIRDRRRSRREGLAGERVRRADLYRADRVRDQDRRIRLLRCLRPPSARRPEWPPVERDQAQQPSCWGSNRGLATLKLHSHGDTRGQIGWRCELAHELVAGTPLTDWRLVAGPPAAARILRQVNLFGAPGVYGETGEGSVMVEGPARPVTCDSQNG